MTLLVLIHLAMNPLNRCHTDLEIDLKGCQLEVFFEALFRISIYRFF